MNDLVNRVAANVELRIRDVIADVDIRQRFALATAKHFDVDLRRTLRPGAIRVRLATAMLKRIDYVAQSLAWMIRGESSMGQQAGQTAEKTLRALKAGRTTFGSLEGLAKEFRASKRDQECRNAELKARAPRSVVLLHDQWTATRVSTEKELVGLGRKFENCLATGKHSKAHRKLLRNGGSQYWVICDKTGEQRCILHVDHESRQVYEIKGPGNRPPYDCCDAILEFMSKRKFTVGYDDELAELGISDELIVAISEAKLQVLSVNLGGTEWKLRVAPGMLVGQSGEITFTLRGQPDDESDYFCASGLHGYKQVAKVRCALRKACLDNSSLAQTLACAFEKAEPVIMQDWFGLNK